MATKKFFFTNESPQQSLFTDVQVLNGFNVSQLNEFVIVLFQFLAQDPSATELLKKFSDTHGVNMKILNSSMKGVLYFFGEALKKNMGSDNVKADLMSFGLAEEKASAVGAVWQKNFVALTSGQIDKTLVVNELVDMEWKFGVTTSSDELDQVGSCFLQLKLVVKSGSKKENVVMELTLPQFYQFFATDAECAKAVYSSFVNLGSCLYKTFSPKTRAMMVRITLQVALVELCGTSCTERIVATRRNKLRKVDDTSASTGLSSLSSTAQSQTDV